MKECREELSLLETHFIHSDDGENHIGLIEERAWVVDGAIVWNHTFWGFMRVEDHYELIGFSREKEKMEKRLKRHAKKFLKYPRVVPENSFGALLVKAREAKGVTMKEIEALSGVSQSMISRIESGERKPMLGTALSLMKALGIPLHMLERVRE